MWGWVKPLLEALLDWLEKQSNKPQPMEDVKTPKPLRDRWAAYLRDKLRDKNSGH